MCRAPGPSLQALLTLCVAALLSVSPAAGAQDETGVIHGSEKSRDLDIYAEVSVEHSDNIFRLTEPQKSRLTENNPADVKSGRIDGMESASDYIVSPVLGMKYDIRGLGGEDLRLSAQVKYNFHTENSKKNYPEARVRLKNDIGKKGRLVLEGNFLFDFFKKNYLAGYTDENGNGNIPRDERIYSPAIYSEYEGILAYGHELYKKKDTPLSQADLQPFFGLGTRRYNPPFENRDREVALGGLGLTLEFFSRLDLELVCQYEKLRTPGDEELVLFDETRFDTDVNGDGEIKGNAPLVTRIDRSANRYTLEINPRFKVSKDTRLFLGYESRKSDYTSDNPLDVDHYDNTSQRRRVRAGIRYDVSKSWSTELEYRRTDDEDPEDGDYTENRFTFSIKYDLP